jgi:hypothetical protein
LVVTLSGAAVGDIVALLTGSDLDHTARDDGTGKGGTEKVDTLVNGVALNSGYMISLAPDAIKELTVDELLDELPLEVLSNVRRGSG